MKRNRPSIVRNGHDADDQWLCKRAKEKIEKPSGRTSAHSGRRRIPGPALRWLHGKSNGQTDGHEGSSSQTRQSSLLTFLSPQPDKGRTVAAGGPVKADPSQTAETQCFSNGEAQMQTASIHPSFSSSTTPSPSKQPGCWEDREGDMGPKGGRGLAADAGAEEGTSPVPESYDVPQPPSSSSPGEVITGSDKECGWGFEDSVPTSTCPPSPAHHSQFHSITSTEECSNTKEGETTLSGSGSTDIDGSVDCFPCHTEPIEERVAARSAPRTLNLATLQFSQSCSAEAESHGNDSLSPASSLPQTLVLTCSDRALTQGCNRDSPNKAIDKFCRGDIDLEDDLTPTFEDSCLDS